MNCIICKNEMRKASIIGKFEKRGFYLSVKTDAFSGYEKKYPLLTYFCEKCGHVEFVASNSNSSSSDNNSNMNAQE